MSGASFQEFFLLLILGLMILGPKRLPQVANQIGSWLGQARRMTRMMKRQLEDEINVDLDDFNVKKQLGLDGSSPAKSPSVSSPSYVHDPKPAESGTSASGGRPGEKVAEEATSDEDASAELPDDYSPAHAADELGTGVADDKPVEVAAAAADESTDDSVTTEAPDDKKEAG